MVDSGVRLVDSGVRLVDSGVRLVDSGVRLVDSGICVFDLGVCFVKLGDELIDGFKYSTALCHLRKICRFFYFVGQVSMHLSHSVEVRLRTKFWVYIRRHIE